MAFQKSIEQPQHNIDFLMNVDQLRIINENRHIVKCCAESILFCGHQGIALRGDVEHLDQDKNPGNFLSMLKVIANHDSILKAHLERPRLRNATYISPQIQNEIIDVIGKTMIQKCIVEEVKRAQYYSIMIDEITSHNKELMPLCVRFVDSKRQIREEFLQFSRLSRITGVAIAKQVCSDLTNLGLELKNIRGQGYDGASNMSSARVGVQALIRHESPLAVYTHCSSHCLNLVICHSCSQPLIRNALDSMKATSLFFLNSPKRNGLLIEIVSANVIEAGRRQPLIDMCKTRWAERHSAYQHFYQCYSYMVIALEVIALGQHRDSLSDNYKDADWDNESKSKAGSLLHGITNFEFLVVFLIAYQYLSHLAGITIKLQRSTLDIIEAHQQVDEVSAFYKKLRSNVVTDFCKVYQQAERMATSINVAPSKPRNCSHQRNRPNASAETIEEWYRINVAIPFLDHIINELGEQFSSLTKTSLKLLGLVPSVLCQNSTPDLSDAIKLYSSDLPSPEQFDQEYQRWKHYFACKASDQIPTTCASAIKECDQAFYPNIYALLTIACTLPVTSTECERNASTLRRLHNYMRAGMTDDRLTSLALMHIHYEHQIDLDTVVQLFSELHPRRLKFSLFE